MHQFRYRVFDRNALNFLMPYVQPELGLSFTEVGLLGSALSLTWAIAANEVAPERRGIAMGITQNLGTSLLGSTLAPTDRHPCGQPTGNPRKLLRLRHSG
jgi:MFS family permease